MGSEILLGVDDRISDLPELLLGKIVSCLPTKNVVATSLLSTRWKKIFPAELPVINIDLCNTQLLNPTGNEPAGYIPTSFIHFVDKLLRDVPFIDSFSLTLANILYDDEQEFEGTFKSLITWISAAMRLGVKEIRLDCPLPNTEILFVKINGCATLTRLELKGNHNEDEIVFYIQPSFSLPVLKTLDLSRVAFNDDYYQDEGDECTLTTFINGCPALEELSLTHCNLGGLKHICIISTQDLEGHIDVQPWYYQHGGDLLFDCRKTRQLYVALAYIEVMRHENKQLQGFQNLTRLSLEAVRSNGWNVLACILHNAPNLEELKFTEHFYASDKGFADFERLVPSPPTCLELSIRTIEFRHFDENEDGNKLLDYFVKNGKVLEKVVLNNVTLPIRR